MPTSNRTIACALAAACSLCTSLGVSHDFLSPRLTHQACHKMANYFPHTILCSLSAMTPLFKQLSIKVPRLKNRLCSRWKRHIFTYCKYTQTPRLRVYAIS